MHTIYRITMGARVIDKRFRLQTNISYLPKFSYRTQVRTQSVALREVDTWLGDCLANNGLMYQSPEQETVFLSPWSC